MSKILIFTGKGGVGKSSVACAHAVKSAKEGVKTLLVSTDMAHNIADIFQVPVGHYITPVSENLYGLELDPDLLMKEEFVGINKGIRSMFSEAGVSVSRIGEDMMMPGFDDLFCLLKIGKIFESKEFDRIIVDCAPTGETLSLLKLPELLSWYLERFFPVGKMMVRVLSPVSKYKYHVNLPSKEQMNNVERLFYELIHLQDILKNHENCQIRLVCTPEKMVVEETKRSFMYLKLYDYQVNGVFINRVLPDMTENAFFTHWKEIQAGYIKELEQVFCGYPVTKVRWYPKEIRGMEAITLMVEETFAGKSSEEIFDCLVEGSQEEYVKTKQGYDLILSVPNVSQQDVTVTCFGMDVCVILHNFKRRIPLPNTLRGVGMESYEVEAGKLVIHFIKEEVEDPCES